MTRPLANWQTRKLHRLILLLALGVGLACNAVTIGTPATLPPPPAARTQTAQPPATAVSTTPEATEPAADGRTPLPTFTPRTTTRDPNVTPRPSRTPLSGTATLTATATLTPTASSAGPLSLSYSLNWRISDDDPSVAIASVRLFASGGNGEYRFYHDDLLQPGPEFTFRYTSCRGKPGSFRVDSEDGQTARVDYFERAPCSE